MENLYKTYTEIKCENHRLCYLIRFLETQCEIATNEVIKTEKGENKNDK